MAFSAGVSSSAGISATDNGIDAMMPIPVASHNQKVMLHLILIVLTKEMQWCH